jgi:hypothetical protein
LGGFVWHLVWLLIPDHFVLHPLPPSCSAGSRLPRTTIYVVVVGGVARSPPEPSPLVRSPSPMSLWSPVSRPTSSRSRRLHSHSFGVSVPRPDEPSVQTNRSTSSDPAESFVTFFYDSCAARLFAPPDHQSSLNPVSKVTPHDGQCDTHERSLSLRHPPYFSCLTGLEVRHGTQQRLWVITG